MPKSIIQVNNLTKQYSKGVFAVNDISFEVKEGEFFAFLGPNGAGKSTTINILCTTLSGYGGSATICGAALGSQNNMIQNQIGIVFQDSVLDGKLTVRENIQARAGLYAITGTRFSERLKEIAKSFELESLLDRKYETLSGGQRRRTDIARALINRPKLLFLDEPTTGLDPQTRSNVWKTLTEIKDQTGMTLFLTTHYMEETNLTDRVAIIDDGVLAAMGTPHSLKDKYSSDTVKLYFKKTPKDRAAVEAALAKVGSAYETKEDFFEINTKDSLSLIPIINNITQNLSSAEIIKGDMDSVFLNITGKKIREG